MFLDYNVSTDLIDVRKVCTGVMTTACPQLEFGQLVRKIRKAFKRHHIDLEIHSKLVPKLLLNEFYVNAYYCQVDDKNNECAIELVVYHNIKSDTIFAAEQIGQFLVQIYDAVVHEFRHRYQGRRRNFKCVHRDVDTNKTMSYLSDPDEVDAYALSISIELIRHLGKARSVQYLHRASRLAKIRPKGLYASVTLFHYFRLFDDEYSPVIRKLIKKVYLHLLTLDETAIFY